MRGRSLGLTDYQGSLRGLCRARIRQSGPLLAELAGRLAEPGPVPVQGVAIVS
jgi:hypothetical protein